MIRLRGGGRRRATWSPAHVLLTTATLLPSGRCWLWAGYNNSHGYLGSAELYDPASGTWMVTGLSLRHAREFHTATLLAVRQGAGCGGSGSTGALSSAELYDPAQGNRKRDTGSLGIGTLLAHGDAR